MMGEDVNDANLASSPSILEETPGMYGTRPVVRLPVSAASGYYNMCHRKRGIALIFNHEVFDIPLNKRTGTHIDRDSLSKCLIDLQFDVRIYDNISYAKLCDTIEQVASADHSENDCLLIAILSHGEMGVVYSSDSLYQLETVWKHFTADLCPSLAGKPKIFIIQACQGCQLDAGVTLADQFLSENDGTPNIQSYRIPVHADFLIAYSTIPGFYSWRNTTAGSWFIQALCEELKLNAEKYDLLTILTYVSRRVAIDYEANVPGSPKMHRSKQIPCITSMLTRLVVFPKNKNNMLNY